MTDACPRPWSTTNEDTFIREATAYYKYKNDMWVMGLHKPEVVRWLYHLGRDLNLLKKDYGEFEAFIYGKRFKSHIPWYTPKHKFQWCQTKRWGLYNQYPSAYRVLRKFTRMPWHRKKDTQDKSWWEYKQITRDRRRRWRGNNSWKKSTKKESKGNRRTQERVILAAGQWERLPKRAPRWEHADRWSYD